MRKIVCVLTMLLVLGMAGLVWAGEPTEVIRVAVDEIMAILRDPKYKNPAHFEEQKSRITATVEKFIDKRRFAQITLGRDWRRLNPAQQEEFTELYARLVEDTYVDRISEYSDEKVIFKGESMTGDNKAEVSTVVVSKSKEIPVVYRLFKDEGRWRAYDVLVEGVSLVMNYRSQFNQIMASGGPERLLEQLRQKTKA